jgi:hypothetical protein
MTFAGTPAIVSCMFAVSPLQIRFRTPRRANARRSCARACVHRRWCYMQRTSVVHPGAVGVSRPWQTNRSCKWRGRHSAENIRPTLTHGGLTVATPSSRDSLPQNVCVVSPSQMRFPNPRRADARRSCSSFASSPNSARFSPDTARFTDPRRVDGRRDWCDACREKQLPHRSLRCKMLR